MQISSISNVATNKKYILIKVSLKAIHNISSSNTTLTIYIKIYKQSYVPYIIIIDKSIFLRLEHHINILVRL